MSDHHLSSHRPASSKEVWTISYPIILSLMSGNLMIFMDRLILANFSLDAMNAVTLISMFSMIFFVFTIGSASIVEVFVGQLNGSKKYREMGNSVWQMIWFSLASFILFYPLISLAYMEKIKDLILPTPELQTMGLPYLKWIFLFGPTFPLLAALSSFYIGIGEPKRVMRITIVGNLVNIGLDYVLIFGLGPIPSLGTSGAAIATGIAQLGQILFLFFLFLTPPFRTKYATLHFKFYPKKLAEQLKIGVPGALGHMIEVGGWALVGRILAGGGTLFLTVNSLGMSFYSLLAFAMEGIQKGVSAVASNYLGASKPELSEKARKSGIRVLMGLWLSAGLFLFVGHDLIIRSFIIEAEASLAEALYPLLVWTLFWTWLYFLADGITWVTAGALTAGGDTPFIVYTNSLTCWFFAILPIAALVYLGFSPYSIWPAMVAYASVNALLFHLRFKGKKWQKILTQS